MHGRQHRRVLVGVVRKKAPMLEAGVRDGVDALWHRGQGTVAPDEGSDALVDAAQQSVRRPELCEAAAQVLIGRIGLVLREIGKLGRIRRGDWRVQEGSCYCQEDEGAAAGHRIALPLGDSTNPYCLPPSSLRYRQAVMPAPSTAHVTFSAVM